ncbi:MAG: isochorismate synthase MenF [Microthrixaceae bacterium]
MTRAQDLTCTTRAADLDPGDPPVGLQVSAFRSPRRELWGLGEALRIELPAPWPDHVGHVSDALAEITSVDEVGAPGSGPVAFGALPFDRRCGATLVVPEVLFGRSAEGARWMSTIGHHGSDPSTTSWPDGEPRTPSEVRVRSAEPSKVWERSVAEATRRIRDGELTKVVLARELCIETDVDLDAATLLARLRATHPAALCFAVDGFVGASPELLVSRVDDIVRAHPMAGTTPRTGEPEADQRRAAELLASTKNRSEHQITIDMVHDTLLPWCSFLDAEPSPSVVPAGPVQHLATVVEGRLSHPPPPVLDLVAALHPTPAVGGWPRDAALEVIDELETADRGRYAGPVGWIDAAGNGAWAVGIRSVQLDGDRARLFAGVGVVADSDPAAELEETRAKAQAVLGTLLRL